MNVGGHDQWRIPVFARKAAAKAFLPVVRIGLAVVFHDLIGTKDAAEDIGRLLDDAGVGDGINDASFAVGLSVLQGEGEG